jgi:hypothetical protein
MRFCIVALGRYPKSIALVAAGRLLARMAEHALDLLARHAGEVGFGRGIRFGHAVQHPDGRGITTTVPGKFAHPAHRVRTPIAGR